MEHPPSGAPSAACVTLLPPARGQRDPGRQLLRPPQQQMATHGRAGRTAPPAQRAGLHRKGCENEGIRAPSPRTFPPERALPAGRTEPATPDGEAPLGSRGAWETGSCRAQSCGWCPASCQGPPLPPAAPPPHTGHPAGSVGVLEPTVLPGAALLWREEASGQRIGFPSCQGNLGLQATS